MKTTTKREFKGIWIPKEIWENPDLSLQEKVFYVEIDSLNNEDGCFATNEYFAKFFNLTKRQVTRVITSLAEKKYISIEVFKEQANKRIIRTLWTFMSIPYGHKRREAQDINVYHSNTVNNNSPTEVGEEKPDLNFFENLELQEKTLNWLVGKGMDQAMAKQELAKFISYWTETSRTGKQRWKGEKYFEIRRRLVTWFGKIKSFNSSPKVVKI